MPENYSQPKRFFSHANSRTMMYILEPFSVNRILWGMHSSISSFAIIPNTNERDDATSEASLFSPIALITKAWHIVLSISYIFTPTVYYINECLRDWCLIWGWWDCSFSIALLASFIWEVWGVRSNHQGKEDGNAGGLRVPMLQWSYIQLYIGRWVLEIGEQFEDVE